MGTHGFHTPGFHTDVGRENNERKKEITMTDNSRQAILMCMTMMEAAAMTMLDTIAEERAALREAIDRESEDVQKRH